MIPTAIGVDYPSDLASRIGFLLAQAHVIAREDADRALGHFDLTAKSYAALATIVSDGPISQKKLSQRIRVDPATMVDVIDSLEGSGHVARRRNANDRREYAVLATAKGRAMFSRAQKALNGAERETVRDLRPDEINALRGLLGRIASRRRSAELVTEESERSLLFR
jgi:DNA-binding MarR family transcriptional regulator